MIFCKRVKQVREKLNLSQEELAKELGVSFATINRLGKGHTHPTYETLQRFEKFCSGKGIILDWKDRYEIS